MAESDFQKLADQHNGIRSGRVGSSLPPPSLPQPAQDFLTKAGNVLETPLTLLGAAMMDRQAHRPLIDRHGDAVPGTSLDNALSLMARGQFGQAANRFSTTSAEANAQRARLGDRGAKWFQHHPSIFAGAGFGEEFANPANLLLGKATELLPLPKHAPSMNRFEDVRRAAHEAPAQRAAARTASTQRSDAQAAREAAIGQERRDAHWAQKQADSAKMQAHRQRTVEQLADRHNAITSGQLQPLALGPGRAALEPPPVGEQRLALPPPPKPTRAPRSAPQKIVQPNFLPPRRVAPARVIPEPIPLGAESKVGALPPGKPPGITVPGSHLAPKPEGPIVGKEPPTVAPTRAAEPLSNDDVADRAELEFRKMAETTGARSQAQKIVNDLYKGLSRKQQHQMVDVIEGTLPTPSYWEGRVAAYRAASKNLTGDLLKHGIAEPGQAWTSETYHPRFGSTLDPEVEAGEAEPEIGGGRGVRKGTLTKHRVYQTREQAEHSGAPMNPDWEPAKTLESHLFSRLQSVQLEKGIKELQRLGLISHPEEGRPPGWVTMENEPDIARFGSPTINAGSAFHPAIAKAIRDVTHTSMNPDKLLSTPLGLGSRFLNAVNRGVSRFEVTNPLYHPVVNVGPNQLATQIARSNPLRSLPEYVKQLATVEGAKGPGDYLAKMLRGQGVDSAFESGAAIPYASNTPAAEMTRPWSDLSMPERMKRLLNLSGRAVENVSAKPLYQTIEPRMARATEKALQKGGVPGAKAVLLARQTVGEPENLTAVERQKAAPAFMFPSWRKSMVRLWPSLLGRSPALYMGPQRAASAYNESRGVSPQPGDAAKLIPGLAAGKDAQGNPRTFSFPSPANIPLQALDLLGTPLAGDYKDFPGKAFRLALTLTNPVLSTAARAASTETAKAGDPGTGIGAFRLWDKDAPSSSPFDTLKQALLGTAQRYAPVKANPAGPFEAIGIGLQSRLPEERYREHNLVEARFRKAIEKLRMAADDATKAGDPNAANEYNAEASAYYQAMQDYLRQGSLVVP